MIIIEMKVSRAFLMSTNRIRAPRTKTDVPIRPTCPHAYMCKYLLLMDEGGRPDGWTIHHMDGFERQNMVICHRWTSSTGTWTKCVLGGLNRKL